MDLHKRIGEILDSLPARTNEYVIEDALRQLAKEVAADCAQIARRKGEKSVYSARLAAISIEDKYDL